MDNHQSKPKCAEAWPPQDRCLPETDDQPCPIVNGGNAQKSGPKHEGAGKKNGGREKETSILATFTFPCRCLKPRKEGGGSVRRNYVRFYGSGVGAKPDQSSAKSLMNGRRAHAERNARDLGGRGRMNAAADGKNKNVTVSRTAAIFVAKNIIMCYK